MMIELNDFKGGKPVPVQGPEQPALEKINFKAVAMGNIDLETVRKVSTYLASLDKVSLFKKEERVGLLYLHKRITQHIIDTESMRNIIIDFFFPPFPDDKKLLQETKQLKAQISGIVAKNRLKFSKSYVKLSEAPLFGTFENNPDQAKIWKQEALHEALRLNPKYAKAWIGLGDTLHPGEAIELGGSYPSLVSKEYLYREAIKCDPESDEGYKKLGEVRTQEP